MKTTYVIVSSSYFCRSDDCFESYIERELLRKVAYFKELASVVSWVIDCGGLN